MRPSFSACTSRQTRPRGRAWQVGSWAAGLAMASMLQQVGGRGEERLLAAGPGGFRGLTGGDC